jgi:hypothetical protein
MKEKSYEFIKQRIGPCGLHCGRCFAFSDGDIHAYSNHLKDALGNFDVYAKRFVELLDDPIYATYPDFKEFLNHLATVSCAGCREEKCKLFAACGVRPCAESKRVDFCFQCNEFPCQKTGFDENLYKRHVDINIRMKEIGVEEYYDAVKNVPRY